MNEIVYSRNEENDYVLVHLNECAETDIRVNKKVKRVFRYFNFVILSVILLLLMGVVGVVVFFIIKEMSKHFLKF